MECKSCTWTEVVNNAASATMRVVKQVVNGSTIFATSELTAFRRSICDGCEYKESLRCKACGCFIEAKTKLVTESCPKGAW